MSENEMNNAAETNETTAEAKKAINFTDLEIVKQYIDQQVAAAIAKFTDGTETAKKAENATYLSLPSENGEGVCKIAAKWDLTRAMLYAYSPDHPNTSYNYVEVTHAEKAEKDSDGNIIKNTYCKKTDTVANAEAVNGTKIELTQTINEEADSLDNVNLVDALHRLHAKYPIALSTGKATIDAIIPIRKLIWSGSQASRTESGTFVDFTSIFNPVYSDITTYFDIGFTLSESSDAIVYHTIVGMYIHNSKIATEGEFFPFNYEMDNYGATSIPTYNAQMLNVRRASDDTLRISCNKMVLTGAGDVTNDSYTKSSCASTAISVETGKTIYLKTVHAILQ